VTATQHGSSASITRQRFDFKARLTRLHEPHIAPLTDYARRLSLTGRGFVPFFDPLDGGVNAAVLFLFEKAGPTAQTIPIVTFDGDNSAAVHARQFRTDARIPREWTVVWNLMLWWDGQRKYTAADRQAGLDELPTLFKLLPKLRVVVLVGAQAAKAKAAVEVLGFAVITSAHTSMLCRNGSPDCSGRSLASGRRCIVSWADGGPTGGTPSRP
jgi:hypothetical protein